MNKLLSTERTTFRLVVVDLLVPLHLGPGLEYFAAVADKIFFGRNFVQMVPVPMLRQIREPPEVLIAVGALDRCLARMYPHVFDQLLFDHKFLATQPALMVLDAQVAFNVQRKVWPIFERSAAGVALRRVRHQVGIKQLKSIELLFARPTNVGPLASKLSRDAREASG